MVVTFHLVADQKSLCAPAVRRLMQNSLVAAFAFQTMNVTTIQIAVTANQFTSVVTTMVIVFVTVTVAVP
jgi:hypothetical protein